MNITINHPQSGRYQGHNRLIVAAIGVALVVSCAVVVQATKSESVTDSTRAVVTDQEFDLNQGRSAETARLVAVNDIPWAPTTSATDAAVHADGSDRAFFLSINDAAEPSSLGATTADGDLAFFLSINDVDG